MIALLVLLQLAGNPLPPFPLPLTGEGGRRGIRGELDSTYWQQRVAYRITASLDEPSGVLSGRATIVYVNQSPDTLHEFFVHQYLNAFRPGSRWAAADSAERRVRFQHMRDPDYAYERIRSATVMGEARRPEYPFAPDSTIARWPLPRALAPGDSMTVEIVWDARPSTRARRQGRQGRRFDFAQWYPRVVTYDRGGWQPHPLYPGGEFYGEFATYDVTLDLPADQVIGATGVPVEGDPGWESAKVDRALTVDYQRDWYSNGVGQSDSRTGNPPLPTRPTVRPSDQGCGAVAAGRKCVRFFAADVHHFAFSLNPEYRYEQGRYGDVVVRVLYLPGDTATWGKGIAVQRTAAALAWLDTLFGAFPWPQLTNVHRIDGGGTEFPMMVMDGSASEGLIVHEVGHNYLMGILANNEWREGWLDEGFTSFQTSWYGERRGYGSEYRALDSLMLRSDLDGWSEPVSMVSEHYNDFDTYNRMIYDRGELFLDQLRYVVGDSVMRVILREYYARWKLKHVTGADFQRVVEDVSRQDLDWLFGEWLHGTALIDYRLRSVKRRELDSGRWQTTVTVERLGDGRMPVEIGTRDTIYARGSGQPQVERITFETARKPGRLLLDPRLLAHDWNASNNAEPVGWILRYRNPPAPKFQPLDNPLRAPGRRDRTNGLLMPVLWSNDVDGVVLGIRTRTDYLGAFDRSLGLFTFGSEPGPKDPFGVYLRVVNPIAGRQPRTTSSIAGWWVEGRSGAAVSWEKALRRHRTFGPDPRVGFDAIWMATTNVAYLDRDLWDDAGTVEAGPWWSTAWRVGATQLRVRAGGRVGVLYWVPGAGVVSANRYDFEAFGRGTVEASVRAPVPLGMRLGARLFAGGYAGGSRAPLQRRIPVAGADPYETFTNPFLRSGGALFVRPDFYYHAPGNGNLRGFGTAVAGEWAVTTNVELARSIFRRPRGVLRGVSLMGFVDAGVVDPDAVPPADPADTYTTLYDGGLGVVFETRAWDTSWTTRIELPLVVNRWDFARQQPDGAARAAFRWQISLSPSF